MSTIITSLPTFLLTIAPAILLMKLVCSHQTFSNNKKITRKIFIFSLLLFIPVLVVELIVKDFNTFGFGSFKYMLSENFLCVALVEEGFKWLLMACFIRNVTNEHDRYDCIVWATASSLGFALVENILYVWNSDQPLFIAILRMFLSVPSHCCYAIVMGYFFGLHRECVENGSIIKSLFYVILSIAVPTILHGSDNFMLDLGMLLLSVVQDIIVFAYSMKLLGKAVNHSGASFRFTSKTDLIHLTDNI